MHGRRRTNENGVVSSTALLLCQKWQMQELSNKLHPIILFCTCYFQRYRMIVNLFIVYLSNRTFPEDFSIYTIIGKCKGCMEVIFFTYLTVYVAYNVVRQNNN